MNKLMGLIIIGAALIGAATAWRFPFSFGENQATNQINSDQQGLVGEPLAQTEVKPANVTTLATPPAPASETKAQPAKAATPKTAATPPAPASETKTQPAKAATQKTAQAPASETKAQSLGQSNQKTAQAAKNNPQTAQAPTGQSGAATAQADETVGEPVTARW